MIEAAKEKCPKLKYILSMQKEANEGNILSLTKSMMEQTIDEDTGVEKQRLLRINFVRSCSHQGQQERARCDADT